MKYYEVKEVFVVGDESGEVHVETEPGFSALILKANFYAKAKEKLSGWLIKFVRIPIEGYQDETVKSKPVSSELGRDRSERPDTAPSQG